MFSKSDRDLLATYLRPQMQRAALLGLILSAGIILQLANPLIARAFIDGAQAGRPIDRLLHLALVFTGVAFLTQAATVAETYVAEDLGWRTTNALRVDLTSRVLRFDTSFYETHNPGELVERIDGDVSAIAGFFSRFVVQVLGNAIFLVGVLGVLFVIDWRIGGLLSLFAATALLFMTRPGTFISARSRAARAAIADLSGYIEERLGGLVDLKANGADDYALLGLRDRMSDRYDRTRAATIAASGFSAGISTVFVIGAGAALAVSAALRRGGAISLGTVFAVLRYTTMLRAPLEQLSRQMNSFQQATGGLVRVRELLHTEASITDGPGASFPQGALSIELDHVSFRYDREPVLQDVSFDVEPGQVLGLLGRTGSGKTTISRLVFRLHDVSGGAIRIGGIDVRVAHLGDLRGRIGLVTQNVQLFEGTLRDNVTLFDHQIHDDRVAEVFRELGLEDWVSRLQSGLDTVVGAGGTGLSAGEAQLVALARVFLVDPGLVVLDEASSRLDPATERLLERAMASLLCGRTGIVIAHRLATVRRADHIVILDAGRVIECGRRADLERDPGSQFARLVRLGLEDSPA